MLHTVLLGIGEDSIDIINHAIRELKENTIIDAIVFDNDKLYDKIFDKSFPSKTIDELCKMKFDKLLICANHNIVNDIVELFRDKLKLNNKQCSSYIRNKIGPHNINWDEVQTNQDIVNQIIDSGTMNDLEKFTYLCPHRTIYKWLHYFEIYERHFAKYRNTSPIVMEIGVFKGGSLQMWKNYFGEGAKIIGIDIDDSVKSFEEEAISIEIGSQEDRHFLKYLKEKYPHIDILIDDGGHMTHQQIITFEEMFPHISYGGTYLCEDLHTSYWYDYGGGYKSPDSYIEYSKNFIDYIHAWHSRSADLQENEYSRSMHSLHYYDSILVIEKEKMGVPFSMKF